ncbi:MAG: hypothetical protein J4473_02955 [Candidatus Aenigmarchaeota archaeon]|nr:hypothetical protein [Candidatus Aenigmarchaeota archaeon]
MNPKASFFKEYKTIQRKFQLPHINDLQKKFKIEFDSEIPVIENIREELSDKIFDFSDRVLEPLLSEPDTLHGFIEHHMISDEDRRKLFEIYKKIQSLKWENHILSINSSEESSGNWIKKAWDLWNSDIEQAVMDICRRFSEEWRKIEPLKNNEEVIHG